MASKRRLRRHECERKVPYPDRDAAQQAIYQLRRRKPGTPYLHVYRCQFAGHFHVGKQIRIAIPGHEHKRR